MSEILTFKAHNCIQTPGAPMYDRSNNIEGVFS